MKILLIEDYPADARLIEELLSEVRNFPCEIETVGQLSAGLARLAKGGIDVVVVDLSLPDSQGLETFLKVYAQAPEVPTVVLTGYDDENLAVSALQEGAEDYLVKGQVTGDLLVRSLRYAVERHRLQAALLGLSLDDLTGLCNRRGFLALAEQHLKLAHRTKKGVALIFADLDDFKSINDSFGHLEGNQALVDMAGILKKTFRASDIIARLGGDEFTVLAIDASQENIGIITERLQKNLEAFNRQPGRRYQLAVSVGVAPFDPKSNLSIKELMAQADEAMYRNKRSKRRGLNGERGG